jgi:hypothetical protein
MRHFYLFLALSCALVLGACSSSEPLTGLDAGGSPTLQDGGNEGGSNNGQCTPPNCP